MPSQWMYYYLLDGDIASNICSWQWVAGSFSSKQYYCNQENINKYTYSNQQQTFLGISYEELPDLKIPAVLQSITSFNERTILPDNREIIIDASLPVLLYNSYNLDPLWRKEEKANRILLLEPSHFRQFPVSEKVIDFILALAQNIEGIQVYVGEVNELLQLIPHKHIFSKEHPAFVHYPGVKDERDWLFPDVTGQYNSFFGYWKKCASSLRKNYPAVKLLIRA
jgi:deoxyribodipyrimidine photo-lyase